MSKFSIGDAVMQDSKFSSYKTTGFAACVDMGSDYAVNLTTTTSYDLARPGQYYYYLTTQSEESSISSPLSFMGCTDSIVTKARQVLQDADTKELRKAGLVDSDGNPTDSSLRVFLEHLMKLPEHKTMLVDLAKKMNEDKKKNKEEGCC